MIGFLLGALALIAQSSPATAAQPAAGSAVIRGQITDEDTGAPIPRALVTARILDPSNVVRQTVADHDGRFEFAKLPAGRYAVSATAGDHRATHIRASFRDRAVPAGAPPFVLLQPAEIRPDANIALPRSLAISGRVVDDLGDPIAGIDVAVSALRGTQSPAFGGRRPTDDRGVFRVFGLTAGRYVVCARVEFVSSTRAAVASRTERFVTTCHPSSLKESEAQEVSLSLSDADGIEIRMRRSRAFTISGTIVDPAGAVVESPSVNLMHYRGGGSSSIGTAATGGHFVFSGLTPGDYGVHATIGAANGRDEQQGYVSVAIDADDVEGLLVVLKPAATVSGRVTFEDVSPATRDGAPMLVSANSHPRISYGHAPPARVDTDGTFTLNSLFGTLRLDVQGVPRGWVVKAVRYKGVDITERPAEFATDPRHEVEIVLTSRVAVVTGSVTDDSGKPASASVILLPADPRRWTAAFPSQYPRASTSRDGRFALPGVAAGDYLILATDSRTLFQDMSSRRLTLDTLAKHAERISLTENDKLTMNLRVVTLPDVK